MHKKINYILEILKQEYPDTKIALEFKNPLELLIATVLSAQCTDVMVNKVTAKLFKKYKKLEDYTNAKIDEFEQEIRSTGFYHNKAKNIINLCKILKEKYNKKIPKTMDELITLPGVGRKTANILLSNAFDIAVGIAVDTHVKRLSERLGLTTETNPDKIEQDLMKIVPKNDWIIFSHLLISHGRNICFARKPDCHNCSLTKLCNYYSVISSMN